MTPGSADAAAAAPLAEAALDDHHPTGREVEGGAAVVDHDPARAGSTAQRRPRRRGRRRLIIDGPPSSFLSGDRRVRRLLAGYRAVELDHLRTTGVVPNLHLVVPNREIIDDRPWVANNLYAPFLAARVPAVAQLLDTAVCTKSLVWTSAYAEKSARRSATRSPMAWRRTRRRSGRS